VQGQVRTLGPPSSNRAKSYPSTLPARRSTPLTRNVLVLYNGAGLPTEIAVRIDHILRERLASSPTYALASSQNGRANQTVRRTEASPLCQWRRSTGGTIELVGLTR